MSPYDNPGPQLVIETRGGPYGRTSHPLTGISVCDVIARLAPHVPPTAVWYVDPGTRSGA